MRAKPTLDCYFSEIDGVCVVHVDTEGLPENAKGPLLRVYVNDGEAVFENPTYPDGYEVVESLDGRFFVKQNGFQVGGAPDRSGAGTRTFATKDLARAFISARRGD